MRIYGIFRGFPGLGRVVSGIALLSELQSRGNEVKAYSYLQGRHAIEAHGIDLIMEQQIPSNQIMPIGINPVSREAEKLIDIICDDDPDLVIVDGEPLFISTLSEVFPRQKVLALMNPSDLFNKSNPISSRVFFQKHYLSAGSAIVHGLSKKLPVSELNTYDCNVLYTNTIVRKDVLDIELLKRTNIAVILGGGSVNSSIGFLNSTIEIACRVLEAAGYLSDEHFVIYCNDEHVAELVSRMPCPSNVDIIPTYTSPRKIYSSAKVVVCRAGRNTISEILCVNIPAVLMSSSGDVRSSEQDENIRVACAIDSNHIVKSDRGESGRSLSDLIERVMKSQKISYGFVPGNDEALQFIVSQTD